MCSTYECDCLGDDRLPADKCLGNCWEWQILDLNETLRDWFSTTKSGWFGFSNIIVEQPDGSFARDSGYAKLDRVDDVLDFMIAAGDDFTIRYGAPDGVEWHFEQFSPYEDCGFQKCKVFHTVDMSGPNNIAFRHRG